MTKILAFAQAREKLGFSEKDMLLSEGETPQQLWERLDGGTWPEGWRVAVNEEFVETHTRLFHPRELAFLPPVSGG